MNKFSFLNTIKIRENIKEAIIPVLREPSGLSLRVFKNGKVFPSKELVEYAKLEYHTTEPEKENGLDFFKSRDWSLYPADGPSCLIIGITPRSQPKVDLFAGAKSDKTKVATQGPRSQELIEAIEELFPTAWTSQDFVDLCIDKEAKITTENNIYLIPKKFKKGVNAGNMGYQKRENITLHPCEPQQSSAITVQEFQDVTERIGDLN